jgi:hypothetical protein
LSKSDPIRARYFKSVETTDWWIGVSFYVGAALSFALLQKTSADRISLAAPSASR